MSTSDEMPGMQIPVVNLFDWLLSHGILHLSWMTDDAIAKEKFADLIVSYSSNPPPIQGLECLFKNTNAEYREARQLLMACQTAAPLNQTSLFGSYKHEFTSELYKIVSIWEKNNAHIGNIASLLVQQVKYEMGSLVESMAASEKHRLMLVKRMAECEQSILSSEKCFRSACDALGIEGNSVQFLKLELEQLTGQLPRMVSEVESKLLEPNFEECWRYYSTFLHISDPSFSVAGAVNSVPIEDIPMRGFPVIQTIRRSKDDNAVCNGDIQAAVSRRFGLLDELSELNCFFEMRIIDMSTSDESIFSYSNYMSNAKLAFPSLNISVDELSRMAGVINALLVELRAPKLSQACSIVADKNGVTTIENNLRLHWQRAVRLREECSKLDEACAEVQLKVHENKARVADIKRCGSELKVDLENLVSSSLLKVPITILLEDVS